MFGHLRTTNLVELTSKAYREEARIPRLRIGRYTSTIRRCMASDIHTAVLAALSSFNASVHSCPARDYAATTLHRLLAPNADRRCG